MTATLIEVAALVASSEGRIKISHLMCDIGQLQSVLFASIKCSLIVHSINGRPLKSFTFARQLIDPPRCERKTPHVVIPLILDTNASVVNGTSASKSAIRWPAQPSPYIGSLAHFGIAIAFLIATAICATS